MLDNNIADSACRSLSSGQWCQPQCEGVLQLQPAEGMQLVCNASGQFDASPLSAGDGYRYDASGAGECIPLPCTDGPLFADADALQ
eukprot:gene12812-3392_t